MGQGKFCGRCDLALWLCRCEPSNFLPREAFEVDRQIAQQREFWIIWNPISPKPPTARFLSEDAAQRVATQMARRFAPETFHVLKAVSTARVEERPVTVTPLKPRKP